MRARAVAVLCVLGTASALAQVSSPPNEKEVRGKVAAGDSEAMVQLGWMLENGWGAEANWREAVNLYRRAHEAGYVRGSMHLARMHWWGFGVEKNRETAKKLWEKAAATGHPYALATVETFKDVPDKPKLLDLYRRAAEGGEAKAMLRYGQHLREGSQEAAGVSWILKAAQVGDAEAAGDYSSILVNDRSQLGKAVPWAEQAARSGAPRYVAALGFLHFYGWGVPQNLERGLGYLRQAAEIQSEDSYAPAVYAQVLAQLGRHKEALPFFERAVSAPVPDYDALAVLGRILFNGEGGLPRDQERGLDLMRRAAEGGPDAAPQGIKFRVEQYLKVLERLGRLGEVRDWLEKHATERLPATFGLLGTMYFKGIPDGQKDPKRAAELFRRAAELGDPGGMLSYGAVLIDGLGEVGRDQAAGANWVRRSAETGFVPAMAVMGKLFELGAGVAANRQEAIRWYTAAARGGNAEAAAALKRLQGR